MLLLRIKAAATLAFLFLLFCCFPLETFSQYAENLNTGPLLPLFYPKTLSVVLPCYNCAKTIRQTCASIEESLVVFLTKYVEFAGLSIEIVFVDDCSTDESLAIIEEIANGKPFYRILKHEINRGPGPARNTGANGATGEVLLFGDADDEFLPHHVATCFDMFVRLPNDGFVRTRIDAGPNFHPHWQMAIEDSIPLNTCVRKEAHHFIGGFPETQEFKDDLEDVAYVKWLYECYAGSKSLSISVQYKRYEGNMLDKRMQQFSKPPEDVYQSPDDKALNDLRFKLIDQHINELSEEIADYLDSDLLLHGHPLDPRLQPLFKERSLKYGRAFPILQAEYTTSQPFVAIVMPCMPRAIQSVIYTLLYEIKLNPFRVLFFYDSERCIGAAKVANQFPVHVIDTRSPSFPGILRWALLHCPIASQIRRLAIFAWNAGHNAFADLAKRDPPNYKSILDEVNELDARGMRLSLSSASNTTAAISTNEYGVPACNEITAGIKRSRTLISKFHCVSINRK